MNILLNTIYINWTISVLKGHRAWWGWETHEWSDGWAMEVSRHRGSLGSWEEATVNLKAGEDVLWKDRGQLGREEEDRAGWRAGSTDAGRGGWAWSGLHSFQSFYDVLAATFCPALSWAQLKDGKKKWLLKTMFLLVKWRRQARPRLCDEWCETHNCYLVEEESSQLGACLGQRGS